MPLELTAARLRVLLGYDPSTGIFHWLNPKGACVRPGDIAGADHCRGYRSIHVRGKRYLAHRLAWLHVHDQWPVGVIDHINGDRCDNRIENLRDVDQSTNLLNMHRSSSASLSGFLGVTVSGNKFSAHLKIRGVRHYLGRHDTPEEAHLAYIAAKRRLHGGFVDSPSALLRQAAA